jgi:lysyl-tRNA synthetase class 1
MGYARRWLEGFAPDNVRFTVQPTLPAEIEGLSVDQRRFLGRLADGLHEGMDGAAIQERIWEVAGEFEDVRPPDLFQAIYLALLGKAKGPRAGAFLSVLGVGVVAERFREASRELS